MRLEIADEFSERRGLLKRARTQRALVEANDCAECYLPVQAVAQREGRYLCEDHRQIFDSKRRRG